MELAQIYLDNKKPDEARNIYQKIIENDLDSVEGHYGMGMIYQGEGKTEEARSELIKAKELFSKQQSEDNAETFSPVNGHIHYQLGLLHSGQGEAEKAFKEFIMACDVYDKLVRDFLPKIKR